MLFGMAQGASAATCASLGENPVVPGTDPEWQNADINDCTITYSDPTGGSNLSICQYRVLSDGTDDGVDNPTETLVWTDATHLVNTCSGSSIMLQANITIGSGLNCRNNGENKCRVEFRAADNAGNSATGLIATLDINYNTAPTISDIANQTINEDTNTGALAFTIGDAETAAASLTLAGVSSNTTLVPAANIVFGGSGANRTVTATPAANQNGTATITVTVSDGRTTSTMSRTVSFNVTSSSPELR